MNKPFQVYLSDRQRDALTRLAGKLGRPRAELVRQGIDHVIRQLTPIEDDPALGLIGLACEPGMPEDLAMRHDDYLIESIAKESK